MKISKKKASVTCVACVAAMSLICVGGFALKPSSELTVNASTEETKDRVKVFIGDVDRAAEGYTQQRAMYVEKAANSNADTVMKAVIGLDDYYTVDDVETLAKTYDITINRAYMWPEGETGRLSLYVENGDMGYSIDRYKKETEENGMLEQDEQFAKDYQRFLEDEYRVFALTVTASAETLEALSTQADCISYVDVMYNPEVEKYAKKAKKAVSYIELPAKPDGAL